MSALLLLRDCVIAGVSPVVSADGISVGGQSFHPKTKTAWKTKKGDYLQLDAVCFLLNHLHLKLSDYVRACADKGITSISFAERQPLVEYLRGNTDTTPYIDVALLTQQQTQGEERGDTQTNTEEQERNKKATALVSASAAAQSVSTASSQSLPPTQGLDRQSDTESSSPVSSVSSSPLSISPSLWSFSDAVACECLTVTRLSCLQCSRSLSDVLDMFDLVQRQRTKRQQTEKEKEKEKERDRKKHKSDSRSSVPSSLSAYRVSPAPSVSVTGSLSVPVIVVPSAVSSALTLYNALEFLETGVLVPSSEARETLLATNAVLPTSFSLVRPSLLDRTKTVQYELLSDVSVFRSSSDWNRVVAVFVSGSSWQFEGWPRHRWSSPAAIFESVCAFHLYYSDEPINKNIEQWRLHRLCVNRAKRYADRSLAMEFWNILTEHLKTRAAQSSKTLNI